MAGGPKRRARVKVDLQATSDDPRYLATLQRCYDHFQRYCTLLVGAFVIGACSERTDCLLARFVQCLLDARASRAVGVHTVLAVQHRHGWRYRLNRAWRALYRWKTLFPGRTRLPVPLGVLQLQFLVALSR